MRIKKLTGEFCFLSPISLDDCEQYAVWLNDPDVTEYLTLVSANITIHGEAEALKSLSQGHNYGIVDIKTDRLVGNVGFVDIDQLNRTAEAGIFIGDKEFWGKGYGTEALTLLLKYGFDKLNLNSIMLKVYSFNERAISCYKKAGFKEAGRIRNAVLRDRRTFDLLIMDILPEELSQLNLSF